MIRIDRLRLRLPRHMQPNAELIARHIAETLAATPINRAARMAHCAVPVVRADPNLGPTAVAELVAQRIQRQLRRRPQ